MSRPARLATLGGVSFIAGLVLWYAGAGWAVEATIDPSLAAPAAILALVVGTASAIASSRGRARKPFEAFAIGAALAGFLGYGVLSGANVWLDRGDAEEVEATVTDVRKPSKSPEKIVVATDGGERASFPAKLAPECKAGARAFVRVRPGALGARWVERARCP